MKKSYNQGLQRSASPPLKPILVRRRYMVRVEQSEAAWLR